MVDKFVFGIRFFDLFPVVKQTGRLGIQPVFGLCNFRLKADLKLLMHRL